jgi:hypothetical protein
MKHIAILILILTCLGLQAQQPSPATGSVTLGWSASTSTDITNYWVLEGTNSGSYFTNYSAGTNLTLTISNLTLGSTYYFTATATDTNGLTSVYANEASRNFLLNPQPPTTFQITITIK